MENEGQHLQDVYPQAFVHGGAGRFAFSPAMHPKPPQLDECKRLRERLIACWTPWIDGDEPVLLEKSPPNLTKINWLRSVFPGSRFVILVRDPRAVASATIKWSGGTLTDLIYHWHVGHSAALRSIGDDCHVVRYEDLCKKPAETIAELAEALRLPLRSKPTPLPQRFREIDSTNDKYLAVWPDLVLGTGCWTDFGYNM
jgi:hypothetical protein